MALQELDDGADVLFAAGGETAEAALEAAAGRGALVIGAETDLYASLTQIRPRLVTSAVNNVRSGVLGLVQMARRGALPADEYMGEVSLAPFHDFENLIPSAVQARLEQMGPQLESGAIPLAIPYKSP
jgi:basic membrane protein A